jgi:hypothetical protein
MDGDPVPVPLANATGRFPPSRYLVGQGSGLGSEPVGPPACGDQHATGIQAGQRDASIVPLNPQRVAGGDHFARAHGAALDCHQQIQDQVARRDRHALIITILGKYSKLK